MFLRPSRFKESADLRILEMSLELEGKRPEQLTRTSVFSHRPQSDSTSDSSLMSVCPLEQLDWIQGTWCSLSVFPLKLLFLHRHVWTLLFPCNSPVSHSTFSFNSSPSSQSRARALGRHITFLQLYSSKLKWIRLVKTQLTKLWFFITYNYNFFPLVK